MKKVFFFMGVIGLGGLLGMVSAQTQIPTGTPEVSNTVSTSFSTFKDAYEAGDLDLKNRQFEQAEDAYGVAEKFGASPKGKSDAANAQGWAYLKARSWQEAEDALSRAVSENPNNKIALKNLGVAFFQMYEYGLTGVDGLNEAIKNLEASGDNPELLDRAQADLSREQSYAQVTPVPEPSLAGKSYKALIALGDQEQIQGQFDWALKAFKKAEEIVGSPSGKANAANRAGKALLDARRPQESVPYFERAAAAEPKDKVYLNNLGFGYWVLYDSGKGTVADLKKAVETFYKANAIDSSYHQENLTMALNELKEADPDAAQAYDKGEDKAADDQSQTKDSPDSQTSEK
jgi:tetratricopeptide (TPR) repeat protein